MGVGGVRCFVAGALAEGGLCSGVDGVDGVDDFGGLWVEGPLAGSDALRLLGVTGGLGAVGVLCDGCGVVCGTAPAPVSAGGEDAAGAAPCWAFAAALGAAATGSALAWALPAMP